MNSFDLTKEIVNILDGRKAQDIEAIKIDALTIVADYFVICSATNTTHVKALADEVEFKLKEKGITPTRVEGYQYANWIVIDYADVVVHVFYAETREYYKLGRLWADGEVLNVAELIDEK